MSFSKNEVATVGRYSTWLIIIGILLIILGFLAISASVYTTFITIMIIGLLLGVGGGVLIIDSFMSWWGVWNTFFIHFLLGLVYMIAGIMLVENPILGSISITLILGITYLVVGAFRLVYALSSLQLRWGWTFLNALINFILGILILASWPSSSLFIIGLFVGIDLIIMGWAYTMLGVAAKSRA